jgi:hypothetical protein
MDDDNFVKQIEDAERILVENEIKKEDDTALEPFKSTEIETEQEPVVEEQVVSDPIVEDEGILLNKRVQFLESELTLKLNKIDEALELLKSKPVEAVSDEYVEEGLPDDATPYEISEYIKAERVKILAEVEKRQEQKTSQRDIYSKKYAELIGTLSPEKTPEIYKAMTDTKDITYNSIISGDPEKDFLINYRRANEEISAKKEKNVVYGKQPRVPTGINIPNSTAGTSTKTFDRSKLSPMEADIARMFSDDDLSSMSIN